MTRPRTMRPIDGVTAVLSADYREIKYWPIGHNRHGKRSYKKLHSKALRRFNRNLCRETA